MAAPDFYFAVNAIFRHIHDRHGRQALIDYWRALGRDYYAPRVARWKAGGADEIARDWRDYFAQEPQAQVQIRCDGQQSVELDIQVCPAIKHLRDHHRQIVEYFCEHCDYICGAMAEQAGFRFHREGGMGSCRQQFVRLTVGGAPAASCAPAAQETA